MFLRASYVGKKDPIGAPLPEPGSPEYVSTGYPEQNLKFIVGRVEDTLPGTVPRQIALLRLDTDWYSSTMHEMDHLFPRLQPGGVLIVDDYGWWRLSVGGGRVF
jgi:hypothetical protein